MKKIMFVTGSLIRGGAERVASILANDYARRGWKVRIVMVLHSFIGYDIDPSIEIIDISNDKRPISLYLPFLVGKLRGEIKSFKPDSVVSMMWNVCLVSGLASIGLKSRFITSERIDPNNSDWSRPVAKIMESIYAHSDCCVLQTKRAYDYFPKKVQKKSVIIPNPIEAKAYAEYGEKRIVTCGRLTKQKNHKMLIDAFASVSGSFPEWKMDIYGEGPLEEELRTRIKEKELEERIQMKGNVSDLHDKIKSAEIFVLSSDYEGLSNALMEAMMMGLPCISTDCAGSDEIISDGENGLLVPVGDKESLEKAMARLMDDREFAHALGKRAKETAKQYESSAVIKRWREVIEG